MDEWVILKMCTLHAVIVLCFCCWQGLASRSMRIQDLYVGPFPIPRCISLFFKSYARAHVPCSSAVPASIACGSRGILWKRLVVRHTVFAA